MRGKGKIFPKKLEDTSVKILVANKEIEIGEWKTDEKGRFTIEIEKELLDKVRISI